MQFAMVMRKETASLNGERVKEVADHGIPTYYPQTKVSIPADLPCEINHYQVSGLWQ